jgi:hypothetical protein
MNNLYAIPYTPPDEPPPIQQDFKLTRRIRWRPVLGTNGTFSVTAAALAARFPITNVVNFTWSQVELRGATNCDIYLNDALSAVSVTDSGVVGSHRARCALRTSPLNRKIYLVNGTEVLFSGTVVASATEAGQQLLDVVVTMLSTSLTLANPSEDSLNEDFFEDVSITSAPSLSSVVSRNAAPVRRR